MHKIYCINDNIISSKIYPALLITLFWVLFVLIFFFIFEEGRGGGRGLLFFVEKNAIM